MADPIWPTEPWYLFVIGWQEPSRGYLIEHTHRIAAFTVGGLVSCSRSGSGGPIQAEVRAGPGIAALVVLLAGFGQFHGGLIAQREPDARRGPPADGRNGRDALRPRCAALGPGDGRTHPPCTCELASLPGCGRTRRCDDPGITRRVPREAERTRRHRPRHGPRHLRAGRLLPAHRDRGAHGPGADGRVATTRIAPNSSAGSVVAVRSCSSLQVVLGALVRHAPTPLTQRLHFLTAFLAAGVAVWLLLGIVERTGRPDAGAFRVLVVWPTPARTSGCTRRRGVDGEVRAVTRCPNW